CATPSLVGIHIHTNTHTSSLSHTHTLTHTHTHSHTCSHRYAYTHTRKGFHMYTHTYTHVHTHTHTYRTPEKRRNNSLLLAQWGSALVCGLKETRVSRVFSFSILTPLFMFCLLCGEQLLQETKQ